MPESPWGIQNEQVKFPLRPTDTRHWFQRDIDQITHSIPFRKLQYKSQLLSEKDPISRSRLIHTIEASRIATEISGRLELNQDLTEAIILGHDIATSPYGAVGNKFLKTKVPSFSHELAGAIMLQSLAKEKLPSDYKNRTKILEAIENAKPTAPFYIPEISGEELECKYSLYAGGIKEEAGRIKDIYLYLITPEVIDGVLCHGNDYEKEPETMEGQVVRFADNIAYISQDIDDLLRAKILNEDEFRRIGYTTNNNYNLDWEDIDGKYAEGQKLNVVFHDERKGKRIGAFIERYVSYNQKSLEKNETEWRHSKFVKEGQIPVLKCDDGLQSVINAIWEYIPGHYDEQIIATSNSLQTSKLEQLWKILEEDKSNKKESRYRTL